MLSVSSHLHPKYLSSQICGGTKFRELGVGGEIWLKSNGRDLSDRCLQ